MRDPVCSCPCGVASAKETVTAQQEHVSFI